jgi:hypothetical protein
LSQFNYFIKKKINVSCYTVQSLNLYKNISHYSSLKLLFLIFPLIKKKKKNILHFFYISFIFLIKETKPVYFFLTSKIFKSIKWPVKEKKEDKREKRTKRVEKKEEGNKATLNLTSKPQYIMYYIANNHVLLFIYIYIFFK